MCSEWESDSQSEQQQQINQSDSEHTSASLHWWLSRYPGTRGSHARLHPHKNSPFLQACRAAIFYTCTVEWTWAFTSWRSIDQNFNCQYRLLTNSSNLCPPKFLAIWYTEVFRNPDIEVSFFLIPFSPSTHCNSSFKYSSWLSCCVSQAHLLLCDSKWMTELCMNVEIQITAQLTVYANYCHIDTCTLYHWTHWPCFLTWSSNPIVPFQSWRTRFTVLEKHWSISHNGEFIVLLIMWHSVSVSYDNYSTLNTL